MGIIYKFKTSRNLKKYSNKDLKINFYISLVFSGEQKKSINPSFCNHILGQRAGFGIINPEHHIEMLKRITKISYELAKKGNLLFVNNATNFKFDGIIKSFSYRAGQNFVLGRWPCGLLTKSKHFKTTGLIIFNSKKSVFALKEGSLSGIPSIGINNLDYNVNKIMYPLISNNLQGDSIFFDSFILSNSILEGKLFGYIKNIIFKAA